MKESLIWRLKHESLAGLCSGEESNHTMVASDGQVRFSSKTYFFTLYIILKKYPPVGRQNNGLQKMSLSESPEPMTMLPYMAKGR